MQYAFTCLLPSSGVGLTMMSESVACSEQARDLQSLYISPELNELHRSHLCLVET